MTQSAYPAPNFAAIPADMRARVQWVCWAIEIVTDKDGNPKPTKVPHTPRRGKASTTDPSTWRPFDQVRAAYTRGGYDGIGFVFTESDDLVFVDLDHCFDADGNLHADARALVDQFSTYAERSPNDGLHLFARGNLTGDWHRKGNTEIYWTGRFSTITGNHIPGTPDDPQFVNGPLDALYASIKPLQSDAQAVNFTGGKDTSILSDDDVVRKAAAARNGDKFTALMGGDLFGYDGNQSEADLALCGLLAFWCRNDTAQMDRIFRTSKLMRPKWDSRRGGKTYGAMTLSRACGPETYQPEAQAVKFTVLQSPYNHDNHTTVNFTGGEDLPFDEPPDPIDDGTDSDTIHRSVKFTAATLPNLQGVSERELLFRLKELEKENATLRTLEAEKDARIADLAQKLETAEGLLDRVRVEAPIAAIERLQDQLDEERQARREILDLARDTALKPVSRVVGILAKEAGSAYRPRFTLDQAPSPPEKRSKVFVGGLEVEAGISRGTFSRYIRETVARGHLSYHIVPEDPKHEGGPPRSSAYIGPGDGTPRLPVDLRRQKAKDAAAAERAETLAREAKHQATIAELEAALARATQDGCPGCGATMLPTGYHCASCGEDQKTKTLATFTGKHVKANMGEPPKSRPSINTNMVDKNISYGKSPPKHPDHVYGEGGDQPF